jgi:Histidine kinase-, DNA gyrase B-, and HSP90-like ATPase
MKLSLNVLNHLGINLYSNVPAVLAETVANAWDADAQNVRVSIDESRGAISITDDGHGMDAEAINERFLTVGYRRREEDPSTGRITAKWKRPVMGRKGIGKLSLFSIAREVSVFSKKGNERVAFKMKLQDIQDRIASGEGTYDPPPIPLSKFPTNLRKGTRIVLGDLKKGLNRTSSSLRVRLARRFSVMGPKKHFRLFVDDIEVSVKDRGYFGRLQYLWHYGTEGKRALALSRKLDNEEARPTQVSLKLPSGGDEKCHIEGWLGTVHDSGDLKDDEENLNKVVIMVRGKLAQEDILEEFNEGRLFTKYLIGEIHADFLDMDDQEDSATSSRQKIIEDDPRYVALKGFVLAEVRNIANRWSEFREEEGKNKALETPAIREWFGDLSTGLKKRAKSLFGKINQMPFDKPGDRNRLFAYAVLAFENLRYKENLEALEKMTPENIEALGEIFADLNDVEATLYHQILKGRIEAIDALEEKVEEAAREKVLQKHLYENLWLLDPTWERATDTEYMEKRVATEFGKVAARMTKEEKLGRYDIKYKKNSGKHVIIELKKAERQMTHGQLADQGQKYIGALQKILDEHGRSAEPIEVIFILGCLPKGWSDARGREKGSRALAEMNMRVVLYQELLDNAHRAYKEFIDKRRHAGRLTRVLQSIDKASL